MNQILSTAAPKAAAPQSIAEVRGALSFIRTPPRESIELRTLVIVEYGCFARARGGTSAPTSRQRGLQELEAANLLIHR